MSPKDTLATCWLRMQGELLPWLDDMMGGPASGHHKQLVCLPGMVRIEAVLPSWHGLPGRPRSERAALARACIAKAVFNLPATTLLIDMLSGDKTPRRPCGWQRAVETPTMIRFGAMTADEVFVSAAAARAGVRVSNTSRHENLVALKHFGPGNPDAASLIRS